MPNQLYTTLNNGIQMPLLGLGVYDMYNREAEQAVLWALETGYRLIDTAEMYKNEVEIGNAIRESSINRADIFVTTKVNNGDQGFDQTLRAFDTSLQKLNIDYIDLYLVHWPIKATRKDTWLALEKLQSEGRVRAIGVANYLIPFLSELESYATITPAVNQVEFSPYLYLKDLLEVCKQKKIQLQAYTPLIRGMRMQDPKLLSIANKYQKTPAQIILRWALQHGVSSIPKSANLQRIKENFDVFDFEISHSDMNLIDNFNENLRVVEDPMDLF
ncbi:aldo/keto reductase [Emticicia oligotrophica DSM 17448]|uniref:Aldo/keto reductase n=1 Tax=Emticicia oligotrophica (strain DSM 17448 / CIP 109782 / MTCC 6937 / GPTSA100-15) TaxID=929562 RepID=A0ABM5N093_EMTOG|nr:aldo/keto reductase [Emticicia oligotrophica]AFK02861.1 aldo/keto reductase [Emticicia oligotrophica DSM 17448]